MPEDTEELALYLNGFKRKLMCTDFLQAMETTGVSNQVAEHILTHFARFVTKWLTGIDESFISVEQKNQFKALIH